MNDSESIGCDCDWCYVPPLRPTVGADPSRGSLDSERHSFVVDSERRRLSRYRSVQT